MDLTDKYVYRVKIINPSRKQESPIRDLHNFSGRFTSVLDMKVKIMEEFGELVPPNITFSHWLFWSSECQTLAVHNR